MISLYFSLIKYVRLTKLEASLLLLFLGTPVVEVLLSSGSSTVWLTILTNSHVGAILITSLLAWISSYYMSQFTGNASLQLSRVASITKRSHSIPRKKKSQILEICVSDIESIENCRKGGADSIEICVDRGSGGLSPSIGLVEEAINILRGTDIQVNVLIRPRPGNFVYSHTEFDVIIREVIALRSIGAHGIVVGFLDKFGHIDVGKLQVIRKLSHGMTLTFHRAFDLATDDPLDALNTLIECGCDRVLTSGRCSSAGSIEGIETLRVLTEHASGRIQIIAGGGVSLQNMEDVLFAGVSGMHTGSAVTRSRTLPHTIAEASMNAVGTNHMNATVTKVHHPVSSSSASGKQGANSAVIGLSNHEDLNTWEVVDAELVRAFSDQLATIASNTESWRPTHADGTSSKSSLRGSQSRAHSDTLGPKSTGTSMTSILELASGPVDAAVVDTLDGDQSG